MSNNSSRHHRHSIRLPDYDYSSPGAYFITLVTHYREPFLGEITAGEMHLEGAIHVGAIHELPPLSKSPQSSQSPVHSRLTRRQMLLPLVVGYFKMNTAKKINEIRGTPTAVVWQRNYYEHAVRNERELDGIRRYISNNPLQWELDRENLIHHKE